MKVKRYTNTIFLNEDCTEGISFFVIETYNEGGDLINASEEMEESFSAN